MDRITNSNLAGWNRTGCCNQCRKAIISLAIKLVCLAAILAASSLLEAQSFYGSILGTVTDPSGAVLAKASIDVTNIATGVTEHTETTSTGVYTVPYLQPGTYRVTVQASGFQKSVVEGIVLVVAQEARANVTMKTGVVSQTAEVHANALALDTDSAAVSETVIREQVNDLPLDGRNFLDLLFIGAGVVQTLGEQGQKKGAGGAISLNGQRATSNNYTLDGMTNVDTALGQPAVVLSLDAIQEFKDQSANYGAQYGYSANQINMATRSGTNALHGTVYEFNRENGFDARGPLQTTLPPLHQNQFGFAVGGPVVIPELYDGKNKTFWFANYEGWRIIQGAQNFYSVPSPTNLAGDFTTPITDPASIPAGGTTGTPFAGCTAGGVSYASCIPSSRFSRLASLALTKFFPAPNSTSSLGNYSVTASSPSTQNQQDYRIDQILGRFGTIFGRGTYGTYNITNALAGTLDVPIGNIVEDQSVTTWQINHTVNFGPRIINQAFFGHMSLTNDNGGYPALPADIAALGLTGVFAGLTGLQNVYPTIQFADGAYADVGGALDAYFQGDQHDWDLGDSLSILHGKHTIITGVDFRRWWLDRNVSNDFNGHFVFSGFASGNEVADMLLGYYSEADAYQPGPESSTTPGSAGSPYEYNFLYFAPYVQDDWNVTRNLTVDLGIRYDYRNIPYETHNHYSWRDPTNAAGGLCIAQQSLVTDGIAPVGNGFYRYCGSNHPGSSDKTPFVPRFGFAYRLRDKTVIRGGYGIYFDAPEGREYDGGNAIYPYVSRGAYKQTLGQAAALQTTNQLFPVFVAGPVTPAEDTFLAVIPSPYPRSPYVEQYSLSLQRELNRNTILEVNYAGNRGLHLLSRNNIAQAFAPADPAACQANPTASGCPVAERLPYVNFGTYIEDQFIGYSNYNAMNIKIEHRATDLAITALYTWSKSLDDKSAAASVGNTNSGWQGFLNNHDPALDYGRSDFDVPYRFVTSFIYSLPFGRGKHFLNQTNKAVDVTIGGWQLNGIVTAQSGFPFSITATDGCAICAGGSAGVGQMQLLAGNRANQVGNPYPAGFKSSPTEWFDTAAFAQPGDYTYGTSGRNILRLPTWYDFDLSVFKDFSLTERTRLQVRLETFNTLNNAQYAIDPGNPAQESALNDALPLGNVNSPQYGQITIAHPGRIIQIGAKFYF